MKNKIIILFGILIIIAGCAPTNIVLKDNIKNSIQSVSVREKVELPDRVLIASDPSAGTIGATGSVGGVGSVIGSTIVGSVVGGAVVGVVGGAVAGYSVGKIAERLANQLKLGMKEEVPNILREQFIKEMEQSNLFKNIYKYIPKDESQNIKIDAIFLLLIDKYGFCSPVSGKRAPLLSVTGMLVLNPPFKIVTSWSVLKGWNVSVLEPEKHPVVWRLKEDATVITFEEGIEHCEYQGPVYTIDDYLGVDGSKKRKEVFTRASQIIAEKFIKDMKENAEK